jgi:hypothetical protein
MIAIPQAATSALSLRGTGLAMTIRSPRNQVLDAGCTAPRNQKSDFGHMVSPAMREARPPPIHSRNRERSD